MSLHFSLKVNGAEIGSCSIIRANPGQPKQDTIYTYEYEVLDGTELTEGTVEHRYGDGAWALVSKVMIDSQAPRLEDRECATCGRQYQWCEGLPRWEHDKVVIKEGWLAGRCPECGADLRGEQ